MTHVGLDLLEIGRLERALARRPHLAKRLFTDRELASVGASARPARHLAARFCAKEAASKALELPVLRPLDFELASRPTGAPEIALSGHAARRAEELGVRLACSLTHSRELAGAVVVAS